VTLFFANGDFILVLQERRRSMFQAVPLIRPIRVMKAVKSA